MCGIHSDYSVTPSQLTNITPLVDANCTRTLLAGGSEFDYTPRWSPDGNWIVVDSARDGGADEIYLIAADGSGAVRVTNDSVYDSSPAWNPQAYLFPALPPTPTPTPIGCTTSQAEDNISNMAFNLNCQPEPCPIPELANASYLNSDQRCITAVALSEYRIFIRNIADTDLWTDDELRTILDGIEITGNALMSFYNGFDDEFAASPQDAFITVFGLNGAYIAFGRSDANTTKGCITEGPLTPTEDNNYSVASISCYRFNPHPEGFNTIYTVVHELGHVLTKLTNSDFRELVGNPAPPDEQLRVGLRLSDATFIFGPITLILTVEPPTNSITEAYQVEVESGVFITRWRGADWRRDQKGWGDTVSDNRYPGPCDQPATEIPPPFQQNACNYVNYLPNLPEKAGEIEQEEATTDMFLNWVYFVDTQSEGFSQDDFGMARYAWMNCAMTVLSNKYSWVAQSIDIGLYSECASYGQHLTDLITLE